MKKQYIVLIWVAGLLIAGVGAYYGGKAMGKAQKESVKIEVQSYFNAHKAELKGDQGIQGVAGAQGPAGANGTNGAKGASGANGANGAQGQTGKAGQAGCTWLGWSDWGTDLGFFCP